MLFSPAAKTTLKWVVGLSLLGILIYNVDWPKLREVLLGLSFDTTVLAVVLLSLQFSISAWKWSWALRMHGLDYGHWFLFRTMLAGFFIGNFLPTQIGGDAYRAYKTAPESGFKSRALSAVIVERVVGLSTLLTLSAVAAVFLMDRSAVAGAFLVAYGAGLAAAAIGLLALQRGWFTALIDRVRHRRGIEAVLHNMRLIRDARQEWLPLLGISALFQIVAILIVLLLFRGLGDPATLAQAALVAGVAAIAAILPISINGLGVVEASYAAAAVTVGLTFETAVLVPILIRLLVLPHAVVGGLVFLTEQRARPAKGQ